MIEIPKLALGTWLIGGTKNRDPKNDDGKDLRIIATAIESGINLIDTAQNYASGRCEELVGQAVSEFDRKDYQILTKQMKSHLRYNEVIEGCHASLQRLGLEYIDYFVCHAPNPEVDMKEFFKACNKLYDLGLIKNIGVSNFGPKMLKLAMDASELPIRLNQVSFSLADYDIISTGTYDFCLANNIAIQAYRTLAGSKYNEDTSNLVAPISKKYNLTTEQITIAYLNSFDNINFTIRASTSGHWDEIKEALGIKLNSGELNKIRLFHQKQVGQFRHLLDY